MKNVQQWYKSKEIWKNYGYFRERRYHNQGKSIHCIITKGQLLKKNRNPNFKVYAPFIKAALNLWCKNTELRKK